MKTLHYSMIAFGLIGILIFGLSSAQAQNSTESCVNMTELAKSINPPGSPELPMLKNYTLRCTTMSGSAIQMDYVPKVVSVINPQTNLNPQSMIKMIPDSGNNLSVILHTGQSLHVPVKVKVKDGYSTSSIQFSMVNVPPRVQSWTDPRDSGFFTNPPINGSLANATINVYVDSGAKAGTYDIGIEADGSMMDSSGKYIELNQSEIGTLHLTISGQDNIWSDVGLPDMHMDTICSDMGTGKLCSGFPSYEEYPVTVYGQDQKVTMSVPDLPAGKYVRFVPGNVVATPNGTMLKMIASGIVKPGAPNALFTPVVTIIAQSSDGDEAASYIPIAEIQNLMVIHSPKPIEFGGNFGGNGATGFGIYGVVYDPINYTSNPLQVKLSVLGMDNGTRVVPMPSWLSVSIPEPLFDLTPTIPYYISLSFSSNSAPLGTYPVAIKEDVGDSSFVQDVMIKIYNPSMYHGEVPLITSPSPSDDASPSDEANMVILLEVGMPIAAGISAGVLLFSKKRK
ncbi:MAG: hypothetical protein PXX83_09420 [Candidatus Nitrosotalea sp.]|nr:hypothetical protein [Candidatus Nitrosotalea sp.]